MNGPKLAVLLLVVALIYVMSYFHRVAMSGIALQLMDAFRISASEMGVLGGMTMAAYGLMQMPSGILTDMLGGRRVLLMLNIVAGGGVVWFACSDSLATAVTARFVTGVGLATVIPALTVLSRHCPRRVFVLFTSLVMATAGLGHFVSAPPTLHLSAAVGWRNAMALFGVLTAALGVLAWLVVPNDGETDERTSRPPFLASLKALLASRQYLILCLWFLTVEGGCFCMDALWWIPYMVQGQGLSQDTAGLVSTVLAVGLLVGYPIQGWLSDGVFKARRPVLVVNTVVAVAVPALLIILPHPGLPALMGAVALFGAFVHTSGPVTYALAADMCDKSITGTAMGLVNMTYAVFSFVLQYLYGKAVVAAQSAGHDLHAAHTAGMCIVLACGFIGLVLVLMLKEPDGHGRD